MTVEHRVAVAQEPQRLDVAHDLLHVMVVHTTIAAMDLYGIERDLQGVVGAEDLGCTAVET